MTKFYKNGYISASQTADVDTLINNFIEIRIKPTAIQNKNKRIHLQTLNNNELIKTKIKPAEKIY